MGRKRAAGNEDFGKYVSRRSSGILEVRFPIPEEVRHAFPDAKGRPRTAIIKSLGTTDIKLANAKAEAIKTQLRADIRRASEARGSNDLSDYLQWLFDYDLSSFAAEEAVRAREDLRDRFARPERIEKAMADRSRRRDHYGAALTSHISEERHAVAGWAADEYFRRAGREPDDQSPEYVAVIEECARVLVDGVLAQEALAKGIPVPPPLSKSLSDATARNIDLKGALTDRGRMRLTVFFEETRKSTVGWWINHLECDGIVVGVIIRLDDFLEDLRKSYFNVIDRVNREMDVRVKSHEDIHEAGDVSRTARPARFTQFLVQSSPQNRLHVRIGRVVDITKHTLKNMGEADHHTLRFGLK
jgi:hypothetical protein